MEKLKNQVFQNFPKIKPSISRHLKFKQIQVFKMGCPVNQIEKAKRTIEDQAHDAAHDDDPGEPQRRQQQRQHSLVRKSPERDEHNSILVISKWQKT